MTKIEKDHLAITQHFAEQWANPPAPFNPNAARNRRLWDEAIKTVERMSDNNEVSRVVRAERRFAEYDRLKL